MKRRAIRLESNAIGNRHICIDAENEAAIKAFLEADPARIKKFRQIKDLILHGIRYPELYDKEDINDKAKSVTAIKMFKGGQNIRLYCKEITQEEGRFFVVIAELLEKKKTQKVTGEAKKLILKVAGYEYQIVERDALIKPPT